MIWLWLIVGLAMVWVVLMFRSRRSAHALRLADPRRLQALGLEDEAARDETSGRYSAAQAARLRAVWLRTDPPPGVDDPPDTLDPRDEKHLMLADAIRRQYAASLSDRSGRFVDCTVKPSAVLPFPKSSIAGALKLFVALARGDSWSPFVEKESLTPEDLAVVERSLQVLKTYVDVDPDSVPVDPAANMEFAKDYLGRGLKAPE